MPNMQLDHNNH